jgi:type II secretory pathway component PulF
MPAALNRARIGNAAEAARRLGAKAVLWNAEKRRDFYSLLASFAVDGIPLFDALHEIRRHWEALRDPRSIVIDDILETMRGRRGVARGPGMALFRWVPALEAMAIDAGDRSGDIGKGLRMAVRLSEINTRIQKTLLGEMAYPVFLAGVLCLLWLVISWKVIPVFESLLPRNQWPAIAFYLGLAADNIPLFIGVAVLGLAGFVAFFVASLGVWTGRIRWFLDRYVVPWSVHRSVFGAIVLSCMALFVSSGLPLSEAVSGLSSISARWGKSYMERIHMRMRQGGREPEAIVGSGLYDRDIQWEILLYGRLTAFGEQMERLAERIVDALLKKIKVRVGMLRFVVMVMVAAAIVWTYGSFLSIVVEMRSGASFRF